MLAKFYIMIMVLIIYVLCLLKLIERTLKISAFYADCTSKKLILLKKKKNKNPSESSIWYSRQKLGPLA